MAARLGELLVRDGRITPAQLDDALTRQRAYGGRIGSILVASGAALEPDVVAALGRQLGVRSLNLASVIVNREAVRLISGETAARYLAVPVARAASSLTLAMVDPGNVIAIDDIRFMTALRVEPVVALDRSVRDAIARLYGGVGVHARAATGDENRAVNDLRAGARGAGGPGDDREALELARAQGEAGEAPIVGLVNALVRGAIDRGASDIHLEPFETETRVRVRIDGVLHPVMTLPLRIRDAITSRVKIMARLDIAEKRLPQDGRINARVAARGAPRDVNIRVSSLPTLFGEKLVLRLLDREQLRLDMSHLGFESEALARFDMAIRRPWGLVLVTGPTGSGKTNTLYSAIGRLNQPGVNILTAEDPVEFNMPGVNQVLVRESIGLTFAAALRSFLRQDPNVILVGEIRDSETAAMAVRAALTGHLVLSTLHTNDAPSAVTRLVNMGVERFLVANALSLVCAQRLVRTVCERCREPHAAPVDELVRAGCDVEAARAAEFMAGRGCEHCGQTGYRGRVGLFEVMEMTERMREAVSDAAPTSDLRRLATAEGMSTLRQSGLTKVRRGVTTLEEVVRETTV